MRLRVPAGVRVEGRALGGRFVSADSLLGIAAETTDEGRDRVVSYLERQLDKATAAETRALERQRRAEQKFHDDPRKFARQRAAAEERRERLTAERSAIELAWDRSRSLLAEPSDVELDEVADEWEIGFDYDATGGGRDARGKDVDVNIRLRRLDGQPFTQPEAAAALRQFRDNIAERDPNPVPAGYQLAGIEWQRPHTATGWRSHGDPAHNLQNFLDPMFTNFDNEGAWSIDNATPLRMGSVKRDRTVQ